jgi:hypothetical protein
MVRFAAPTFEVPAGRDKVGRELHDAPVRILEAALGGVPSMVASPCVDRGIKFGGQSPALTDLFVQFSHDVQLGALGTFGKVLPVVGAIGFT